MLAMTSTGSRGKQAAGSMFMGTPVAPQSCKPRGISHLACATPVVHLSLFLGV